MTTRRHFLTGLAGCLCHPLVGKAAAADAVSASPFLCSVVDKVPIGTLAPMVGYGDDDGRLIPSVGHSSDSFKLSPYGTAFVSDVWTTEQGLAPNGDLIVLGVWFLDGGDGQKNAFRQGCDDWLEAGLKKKFAFDFSVAEDRAQIRVSFPDGTDHWSAIGRNALTTQGPTVKLSSVEPRAVLHEIGHVFGLQHEHLFPGAVVWNAPKVIADAHKNFHWKRATTEQDILKKLDRNAICLGDPKFNKASIMSYPIPAGWAQYKDSATGQLKPLVIEPGETISSGDVACLKGLYKF